MCVCVYWLIRIIFVYVSTRVSVFIRMSESKKPVIYTICNCRLQRKKLFSNGALFTLSIVLRLHEATLTFPFISSCPDNLQKSQCLRAKSLPPNHDTFIDFAPNVSHVKDKRVDFTNPMFSIPF